MPILSYSDLTHEGCVRSNNEDSYVANAALGLWLVADGMGGAEAGEVASAIASNTIHRAICDGQDLVEAVKLAHAAIRSAVSEGVGGEGMGTTLVALLDGGDCYEIAWVGDSRAYLWDVCERHLQPLSRDHSMVQELVDAGIISLEDAATHPQRNIITRSLGVAINDDCGVDSVTGAWADGQSILLCSDGLTGELPDTTISEILDQAISTEDAVRRLMQAALDRGGRDNITLVLIEGPTHQEHGTMHRLASLYHRLRGTHQVD